MENMRIFWNCDFQVIIWVYSLLYGKEPVMDLVTNMQSYKIYCEGKLNNNQQERFELPDHEK